MALRKKLGLYVNFRPVRMLPGLKTRFQNLPIDLAIFRENTEDLYSGLEHEVIPGVVESLKIIIQNALVLPNLYGDIISDLAAGLVGGLGIVPGANIGDHHAIFEAVHGTAPDIAGMGLANPTALMQSAVLMLAHLGERAAAGRLQTAIERVYACAEHLTGDVGGKASTSEFTDAVISRLSS